MILQCQSKVFEEGCTSVRRTRCIRKTPFLSIAGKFQYNEAV